MPSPFRRATTSRVTLMLPAQGLTRRGVFEEINLIALPAFDERRILDAAFAAHSRERAHGETIRGCPKVHDHGP